MIQPAVPNLHVDTGLLAKAFCVTLLCPGWVCSEPFGGGFLCCPSLSSLPLLWACWWWLSVMPFVLVDYVQCLLLTVHALKLTHNSKQVAAMIVLSGANSKTLMTV